MPRSRACPATRSSCSAPLGRPACACAARCSSPTSASAAPRPSTLRGTGIARLEGKQIAVSASFLPGRGFEDAEKQLLELAKSRPRATLQNALAALLPASLASALLQHLQLEAAQPLSRLSREARRAAAHALVEWPLRVRDSRGYDFAEVTAGGVPLEEIDPGTMESRKCPGLHLVGEILDVDGRLGGFNFQWAWSSAFVAARGLARGLAS